MKCKNCQWKMTWAEQKSQYGRLTKLGFDADKIKEILPRCSKCVTKWLKDNA